MKTHSYKHLAAGLTLAFFTGGALTAHAADIGFSGSLPDGGWQYGTVKLSVVEEDGVKAIDFNDQDLQGTAFMQYALAPGLADLAVAAGFTLHAKLKQINAGPTGGNFSIGIRLPGLTTITIAPYVDPKTGNVSVSSWNSAENKFVGGAAGSNLSFIDIKAVYKPDDSEAGGKLQVFLNDLLAYEVSIPAARTSHAYIILGGITPERTGQTLVESFQFSVS